MSKYISVDVLKHELDRVSWYYENEDVHHGLAVAKAIADEMEDSGIAEVKHGTWIYLGSDLGYRMMECSRCGKKVFYDDDEPLYSYCPHCGIKMDGDEK